MLIKTSVQPSGVVNCPLEGMLSFCNEDVLPLDSLNTILLPVGFIQSV